MKGLPLKFKLFFILVTCLALIILVNSIVHTEWTSEEIKQLLIFGALAIVSESLPVALPKGGFVTVSYAVFLAAVILFPPGVSLSVVFLGGLLVFGKSVSGQPFFKRIFNASQFVLSLSASYAVIYFSGISNFRFDVQSMLLYTGVALAYMITNVTIVTIALGTMHKETPWTIWIGNIRWAIPNFAALAPLGLLMALIYNGYGVVGILLLTVPLLFSRHSFQLYIDMRDNYLNTIEALVLALEAKDNYTSGHSGRVAQFSVAIAEKLKLSDKKLEFIKYAGVLHDIGKIGVSENILNKPGTLVAEEWDVIKDHPSIGQNIIKNIKFLFDVGPIVRYHHERWDGSGYPDGLKGEEIPLESRIIAVADTYDAMTSDRSYRKGRDKQTALVELRTIAGTQLDPMLVEVFCKILEAQLAEEEKAGIADSEREAKINAEIKEVHSC